MADIGVGAGDREQDSAAKREGQTFAYERAKFAEPYRVRHFIYRQEEEQAIPRSHRGTIRSAYQLQQCVERGRFWFWISYNGDRGHFYFDRPSGREKGR